jgi:proline iminopeptidase
MSIFSKQIIEHPTLYIAALTQAKELPYIVFIHGGPGLNCGALEYLIEHEAIFDNLKFNIILYDQRGCGRSKPVDTLDSHEDNVRDLEDICKTITAEAYYSIAAIAGHSYGAKVLFDYIQAIPTKIPAIFIATAASMLTPRINNLLLDLAYIKSIDREQYQIILAEFDNFN